MNPYRHFVVACVVLLLVLPVPAKAYLDPSSGSMLLQIAVGGFLAVVVTARMYWRKVRSFFTRKPTPE
jgi:membrane protease YdiL (CAAX protease family)